MTVKFITNSTGTQAVRLDSIKAISIDYVPVTYDEHANPTASIYVLRLGLSDNHNYYVEFEQGSTLQAVQALAAPVLAALED